MNNVPELINEICPSCNPTTYIKTKAKFTGDVEDCGEHLEYLYQCVHCGARLWVNDSWVMSHEVKSFVIRSKNGMQFESCEIGKEGQEETYTTLLQAEFALPQIQACFPFEKFEILKAK